MEITITVNSNISLQAIFSKIFSYNSEEYSYVELSEPPYGGTIFITGNIITPSNKTVYDSIVYKGIDSRFMYDRRNGGGFIDHNPFCMMHIFLMDWLLKFRLIQSSQLTNLC